ncbi:NAD-specific glutamate dehydrogenase, partial [mine drainage metagenome]
PAEGLVVSGELALTLDHVDRHGRLVVFRGGKHLIRLRRNGSVLLDDLGHDPTQGFDPERQGRDIEQEDIFDLALQDPSLDGGANGYCLIRIDVFAGFPSEKLTHHRLDHGHPGLPADQKHIIDVSHRKMGVLESGLAGSDGLLDEILDERFQFGPSHTDAEV